MTEIVKRFHRVDIQLYTLFPQKGNQLRISASALVARDIKWNHPVAAEFLESFIDRGPVLIEVHRHSNVKCANIVKICISCMRAQLQHKCTTAHIPGQYSSWRESIQSTESELPVK